MGQEELSRVERERRLSEAEQIVESLQVAELRGKEAAQEGALSLLPSDLEAIVRAIMGMMMEGAAVLDSRGNVLYCNQRMGELLRRPAAELAGRSFGSFVHPRDAGKWAAAFGDQGCQAALGLTLEVVAAGHAVPVHIAICSIMRPRGRFAFLAASDLAWQEERMRQLEHINREMERQREALEIAATTDSMTGAYSSGAVFEVLQTELAYGRRYGKAVSLLLTDIDHFKSLNDSYGHSFGDEVLREFCDRCRQAIRTTDYLVRYGGDEFVVILPQSDQVGAKAVGERIIGYVRAKPFGERSRRVPVTISMGIATALPDEEVTGSTLLKRADQALYDVKRAGRDGLTCWDGRSRSHHGGAT